MPTNLHISVSHPLESPRDAAVVDFFAAPLSIGRRRQHGRGRSAMLLGSMCFSPALPPLFPLRENKSQTSLEPV